MIMIPPAGPLCTVGHMLRMSRCELSYAAVTGNFTELVEMSVPAHRSLLVSGLDCQGRVHLILLRNLVDWSI